MFLASGYPMLDIFVSTLYFILFVFWIILLFHITYDIVRSKDLKGWQKALWVLFILVLPLLGALIYLIARGDTMMQHEQKDADDRQKAFEDYIRRVANTKDDSKDAEHGA
jgi:hypothetical protein